MSKKYKVAILFHRRFEDAEVLYPLFRLREEGYQGVLVGQEAGAIYKGRKGYRLTADMGFSDVKINEFDGIIIPGGHAPDRIRRLPEALRLVAEADREQKIIGHVCHGAQVLISAKILEGRMLTGSPGIMDDLLNAGAVWYESNVVTDGNLISSRRPDDLPFFMRDYLKALRNQENKL